MQNQKKSSKPVAFKPPDPLPGSDNFGKYPWRKWADGKPHKLTHGLHFECKPDSFRLAAKAWAKRNDLEVEVSVRASIIPAVVTVQFFLKGFANL